MNLPLLLLLTAASLSHALDNGLARTPPLGWSTWNYFATHINETLLVEMADVIGPEFGDNPRPVIDTALADAGVEQARKYVRDALGANSRATLGHAKDYAERVR